METLEAVPVTSHIIGESHAIHHTLSNIRKVQKANCASILVTGETGTGKELIAREIHSGSSRNNRPFIPVNCSAIPLSLAESSLFGHVSGAFTGANTNRKGYFELADKGTLFFDEVGDMPIEIQVKLLRVLESGSFLPVGGHREKSVDVRVIAATNENIHKKISMGGFRNDLFFRLARFTIEAPPLRERKEDIPLLTTYFIQELSSRMNINQPSVSINAMSKLLAYHFAGNVRELKNIIERAMILKDGNEIQSNHLIFDYPVERTDKQLFQHEKNDGVLKTVRMFGGHAPGNTRITLPVDLSELLIIKGALTQMGGDIISASKLLKISPSEIKEIIKGMDRGLSTRYDLTDENKIISHIMLNGSINNTECRDILNVELNRASYLLKKLNRKGVLHREKGGRWSRYVILSEQDNI